MGGVNNM